MPMALFEVDTTARLFIARPGVTAFDVRIDLYSDAKEFWIEDDQANGFEFPMVAFGGNDIDVGAGTRIPTYVFLLNGWRVRPQEATHTLAVGGGILLVQGGGDPFVNTLAAWIVRILYQQPVQAIAFNTGGVIAPTQQQIRDAMLLAALGAPAPGSIDALIADGTLTPQQIRNAMLLAAVGSQDPGSLDLLIAELHRIQGLDPTAPLEVTPTSRSAGGINQTVTTIGADVTIERT